MNPKERDDAIKQLDLYGFWKWKSYLEQSEIESTLALLSSIPALSNDKNSKLGECISHPNLLEINSDLFRVALETRLNHFVQYYFQREAYGDEFPYQLARLQYRNLVGPCESQNLHLDSRLPGVWPCISLHCFLYLSDVGPSDGPTEVVPRSHRNMRYPNESDRNKCIPIMASQGDLLLLHSSLWHASSRKTSSNARPIIAFAYNRWWMRQQFLFPYTEHIQRRMDLSEYDKKVLGFYNYPPLCSASRIESRGELPTFPATTS